MAISWVLSVRTASTTNIVSLAGLITVDGVALGATQRVLVKDQTSAAQNGVYVVASGAWTRAADVPTGTSSLTPEGTIRVSEGTLNAHTEWFLATTGAINVGTTALQFLPFGDGIKTTSAGGALVAGRAAIEVNGVAQPYSQALLVSNRLLTGVALFGAASGDRTALRVGGVLNPSLVSLGAGAASAVGCRSDGTLCRANDAGCVTGLSFVGYCDTSGAVTVAPFTRADIDVTDFGFDRSGATFNDGAWRSLLHLMRLTAIPSQRIRFPYGTYKFQQPLGPIPQGSWVVGDGLTGEDTVLRNNTGMGTRLRFYGPGAGVLFDSFGTSQNSRHGGGVCDVTILGMLDTGFAAPYTNTTPRTFNFYSGDASSPSMSPTGVPTGPFLWYIQILTAGALNTATFRYSTDGGTTWSASQTLTAAFSAVGTGVTLNFSAGNYAQNDAYRFESVRNYNECGVEVICDTEVSIRNCRIGGYKYSISIDGGEVIWIRDICFDGIPSPDVPGVHGYQDLVTNKDTTIFADGAFSIRIGSFKTPTSGVANAVFVDGCQFNNCRWGFFLHDGVTHTIRNCNSEMPGGYGVIYGPNNAVIENLLGEGHKGPASIWCYGNNVAGAGPANLTIRNVFFPGTTVPVLADGASITTLTFEQNNAANYAGYPLQKTNGGNYVRKIFGGANTLATTGLVAVTELPVELGTVVNGSESPQALHDILVTGFSIPAVKIRANNAATYLLHQKGLPSVWTQGTSETFDQIYSPSTGYVGIRSAESITYARIAQSAALSIGAQISLPPVDASFPGATAQVTLIAIGTRINDFTKMGQWRIRLAFSIGAGANGTISQVPGTLVQEYATVVDPSFVPPVVSMDQAGRLIVAQLTGHPNAATMWSLRFEMLYSGL